MRDVLKTKIHIDVIEDSIHRELRKFIQEIWDRHHVRIEGVSIDWLNVSTVRERAYIIQEIRTRFTDYEWDRE